MTNTTKPGSPNWSQSFFQGEDYRTAFAASEIGVFRWHFQSDRMEWDETLYQLFGIPKGQRIHRLEEALKFVHPQDQDKVLATTQAAKQAKERVEIRFRCRWPDGSIHWLLARGKTFYHPSGAPWFVAGTCQEITQLVKAEEALRRSEEMLQRVTDAASVLISYLDRKLRFQYVSSGYEKRFQRPLEDIQGRYMWEILGKNAFAAVEEYVQRALKGEVVVYNKELPYDEIGPRYVHVQYIPDITDGHVLGFSAITIDLTESRKLSERAAQLSAIVESSTDAILSQDLNGIIQSWNQGAEHLFGYKAEEMIGQPIAPLIPSHRKKEEIQMRKRIKRGERVAPYETVRLHKDGSEVTISLTISPLQDSQGRLIGASKIARDITEYKHQQEQLRRQAELLTETDRRKDEFLATLAHELRNPLAPIANSLQILKQVGNNPEALEKAVSISERQLQHLVHLVEDLLDVSRITRGKIQLRKEPVTLDTIIKSALEISRSHIKAGEHTLCVEVPETQVLLQADLTRLAQAVSNLLINAAKYTPPGGHIKLTARCENQQVVIAVQDDGIGIAQELLPRIFDMFVQAERPGGYAPGGLGIGLPLVKGLVELHGGQAEAASPGLDQGCTFTIRLPLDSEEITRTPLENQQTEAVEETPAHRILVVDDNVDAADSMAEVLRTLGHQVRTAYHGEAALEAVREYGPTVILLDLGMPGMNGYEVAKRLQQLPRGERPVLIALTGWGQEADRQRSREAGFDNHLVKPVELQTLIQVLGAHQPFAGHPKTTSSPDETASNSSLP
ncbi:PAS sensor protein [Nitrosococcus halophilus Nc 4]|uniref:histidine kinase n=1 Tax=Nitrosococcus halophilus (strain Nc4) TaxID=472759 RepID=D5C3W3_NITHN|nr:PAS domain S-box protein [Nitrosococcus halophilus]ADE15085.1 PAS sensor protein [Nitrosococcus halophilus Nc 4]